MYPDDLDRPTPNENRLDEVLRGKFADFELPPDERVWAGVAAGIGPPPPPPRAPRRRPRPWLLPLLFMFGAFVGGLGGWLLPRGAAPQLARPPLVGTAGTANGLEAGRAGAPGTFGAPGRGRTQLPGASGSLAYGQAALPGAFGGPGRYPAARPAATASSSHVATAAGLPDITSGNSVGISGSVAPTAAGALLSDTIRELPATRYQPAAKESATPPTLAVLIALENRCLDQLPALPARPAPDTAARRVLVRTLRAERTELLRLQRRADSLLLALGEVLPAAALPFAQTHPDTTAQAPSTEQQAPKWSLLLAAAPEQNYLGTNSALRDEATNLRRNQETGRSGLAAALVAEYQLKPRLSLGAGLGYIRTGAELRQARRTTDYTIRYDTTLTTTLTGFTSVSNTYSIRVVQIPQLSPVFNSSGQVIRYDTVYVPRNDTLRSTITLHDTIRSIRRTVTPLLQRYDKTTYQTLRPDYHFLTLPVLVRYRLGRPDLRARWWADLSAGAQLQFFLGGSQLVSTDGGATFRTERVGVGDGPFRPFNLALSGSIALNYALTSRLSLSFAPTLRWQTLSVFRPETGLRQQATSTGMQVGVRFRL